MTKCAFFLVPFHQGVDRLTHAFDPLPRDRIVQAVAARALSLLVGILLLIPLVNTCLYHLFLSKEVTVTPPPQTRPLPVAIRPIPEVGIERGRNLSCWAIAACQAMFRSPVFVAKIREKAKENEKIGELNALMNTMSKEAFEEVLAWAKEGLTNPDGQHDPYSFINKVMGELGLTFECEGGMEVFRVFKIFPPTGKTEAPFLTQLKGGMIEEIGSFKKAPLVLVCHMGLISRELGMAKVSDKVPDTIDIQSMVRGRSRPLLYDLKSVILHTETTWESGHYTVQQIRPPKEYNDSVVTECSPDQLAKNLKRARMFFYELRTPS